MLKEKQNKLFLPDRTLDRVNTHPYVEDLEAIAVHHKVNEQRYEYK